MLIWRPTEPHLLPSADIKKEKDSYNYCWHMTPLSDGYESGSSLSDSHNSSTMGKEDAFTFSSCHSNTLGT